jgi:SdpI/YfhL protein family
MYLIVGGLFAGLGIPLMKRKVPPNYVYGFRVRKTLEDSKIWYDANEYCGRCLFWLGVVIIVCGVVLVFIPDPELEGGLSLAFCPLIVLLGVIVSAFLSSRYLGKLTK